jgi:hypothetical protein
MRSVMAVLLALLALLAGANPAAKPRDEVKVVSNVQSPAGDRPSRLLSLKDMGAFDVSCDHHKARVVFTASRDQSMFATWAPSNAPAQTANIDPGTGWAPGSATAATWQVSNFSEATVDVATVTFTAQPWGDVCVVTLQGTVERRRRQNTIGVTG